MSDSPTVGLLGLGEAGTAIATDLVGAGAAVLGWDPRAGLAVDGVTLVDAPADLATADAILSINAAAVAVGAAASVAPRLGPATLFADLNSAGAALKREVAGVLAASGAPFADVALMATVPGNGIRTPALASGPGAARFVELFAPLGMPVQDIGGPPGAAATRKLLRSVFMKSVAVTAIEALGAAEAAGCGDWLWGEIAGALTTADEALLTRLVTGTRLHAARRAHEMGEVVELLQELGVQPRISVAALESLEALAAAGAGAAHDV